MNYGLNLNECLSDSLPAYVHTCVYIRILLYLLVLPVHLHEIKRNSVRNWIKIIKILNVVWLCVCVMQRERDREREVYNTFAVTLKLCRWCTYVYVFIYLWPNVIVLKVFAFIFARLCICLYFILQLTQWRNTEIFFVSMCRGWRCFHKHFRRI